jgi:beta-glucanase (GH16 family)
MKKLPHLVKYFKYKGGNEFDFFKNWEVVFEENFNEAKLDNSKWATETFWAKKLVGENFSQPGDLQYFSSGNNLHVNKNGLTIQVRKEKAKGKFWNPAAGFVPNEFQYTSDTINTGESFQFDKGILEAKIKYNPLNEVVSFFYLLGEKASPQLNILEMGAKNRMGVFVSDNGKVNCNGISISNLKTGYYLFRIEKTDNQITWKINNQVVFELPVGQFNFPMHLNFASIVVNEVPGSKLPYDFEIAWIKCYQKK